MKSRIISDLCGNRYYVEEQKDKQGSYLEVSEIVKIDGKDMKSYVCDIDQTINSDDNEILDDIAYLKSKFVKE